MVLVKDSTSDDGSEKDQQPKKVIPSKIPVDVSPIDIESNLRGRTLKTYLYMMRNSKAIGVRELQRSLGLSSPSVAYHHLEKLERMGLVQKDQYGEYSVVKKVDVSVLQAFSQIGRLLIPRFSFYAMFFSTLLFGYVLIFEGHLNVFAVVFGVFACGFAWYETIRTWRERPF